MKGIKVKFKGRYLKMKKCRKGFTLIELVVVIAIIGVLAAILVPSMIDYVRKSKLKSANANAKIAYNVVSEYIAWAMANDGRSMEAALNDFAQGCTANGVNCAARPSADADILIYNALSDNGNNAGTVWVLGAGANTVTINGRKSFAVQWADNGVNSNIWGQFPDPIAWDDYSSYISGSSLHPGQFRSSWST